MEPLPWLALELDIKIVFFLIDSSLLSLQEEIYLVMTPGDVKSAIMDPISWILLKEPYPAQLCLGTRHYGMFIVSMLSNTLLNCTA